MQTFFYGLPAYLQFGHETLDTTQPRAVDFDASTRVRVIPFDNTPPFFLKTVEPVCFGQDLCGVKIPPSPFRYSTPTKILALLNSCGTTFRVIDDGNPVLKTDDDSLRVALPRGIRDVRLRCGNHQGAVTCALSGRTPEGQYLFVAIKQQEEWSTKIDSVCVRAEQRNGATLLLSDLSVSGLIGTVTVYDSSFNVAEEHPVFTGTATTEDPVLLLFDYLALHLDDKARALLSTELLTDVPYEEVCAFFAAYKTLSPAPAAEGLYACYTDPTHADLYRAKLDNGLLTDLVDAPHPLLL